MKWFYLIVAHDASDFSGKLTAALNNGTCGKHAGEAEYKIVLGWKIEGNGFCSATSGKDVLGYPYDSAIYCILLSLEEKDKIVKFVDDH